MAFGTGRLGLCLWLQWPIVSLPLARALNFFADMLGRVRVHEFYRRACSWSLVPESRGNLETQPRWLARRGAPYRWRAALWRVAQQSEVLACLAARGLCWAAVHIQCNLTTKRHKENFPYRNAGRGHLLKRNGMVTAGIAPLIYTRFCLHTFSVLVCSICFVS